MSLDSDQLDAFEAVARLGRFSLAAGTLHLTQPALSRRIQSLEKELEATLFTRGHGGAELTETGRRLLAYVQTKQALEGELRFDLAHGKRGSLGGIIRVGGYSTVLNQIVLPSLAPLLRKNPDAQLHLVATQGVRPRGREVAHLRRNEFDFLIGSFVPPEHPDLTVHRLGYQELVAVESTRYEGRADTFLDTRPEDPTTELFLAEQKGTRATYRRSFLHDEDGIFSGVLLGLGRAVVIRSLIPKNAAMREVEGWRTVRYPIFLVYRKQSYYPRLLEEARARLLDGGAERLAR
jgi:DNA-binding transcriptional LysR family regulator